MVNGSVIAADMLAQLTQQVCVHAGFEHSGLNQGRIGGQGAGLLNACEPAGDDRFFPRSIVAIQLS